MAADNSGLPADPALFDAELRPHRSLGPHGFKVLLVTVASLSTVISLPFYLLGAWPVVGFLGLDVAILYLAFRLNYRAARAREHVLLTYLELLIARIDPHGRRRVFSFNPLWVRLTREEDEEFGLLRLALVQRGFEVEVAGVLGPVEKAGFATAFSRALAEARRGRTYNP